MKMSKDDYRIQSVSSDGTMIVLAYFSGMGLEWPATVHNDKTDQTFTFVSNEFMEQWMVGNYSGVAKYTLIE